MTAQTHAKFIIAGMTRSEINHSFLFHGVKILTACKMLKISIARCQIEPEIHIFPTMYIMEEVNLFGMCPTNSPKIMFFCGHKFGPPNFGGIWDPTILKCRHF